MGLLSPSQNSHLSPKSVPPTPNFNPFSPLSPDIHHRDLGREGDLEALLNVASSSFNTSKQSRRTKPYTRRALLRIAKRCRLSGWLVPSSLEPLEAWYGSSSPVKSTHTLPIDDPAIASIGYGSGPSRRNGGFGEGFGYGGGIGNKTLGRGQRHGVRKEPAEQSTAPMVSRDAFGGPMGKFSVRPPGERMKLGGDDRGNASRLKRDDVEWRREKPGPAPSLHQNRPWNTRPLDDDSTEPAWMDDANNTEVDPVIADSSSDPLIKFVPGEDMIAAHKRAMKRKEEATSGIGQSVTSVTHLPLSDNSKALKQFNAADYILPSKDAIEEDSTSRDSAFQSRFQRFFAAPHDNSSASIPTPVPVVPASPLVDQQQQQQQLQQQQHQHQQHQQQHHHQNQQQHQPQQQHTRVDDHMARLMGLLQSKPSSADSTSTTTFSYSGPMTNPPVQQTRISQPAGPPSFSRPPLPLQTDPLQLLAQAQRQTMTPHHQSMPPPRPNGLIRAGPPVPFLPPHRDDFHHLPISSYQQLPHPQNMPYQQGPPGFLPNFSYTNARPLHSYAPPDSTYHVNPNQTANLPTQPGIHRDILADLFTGLRPK